MNKLLLDERPKTAINKTIEKKKSKKNIFTYYHLAKLYYLDENFLVEKMSSYKMELGRLYVGGHRVYLCTRDRFLIRDRKYLRLNGEVYAFGGYDKKNNFLSSIWHNKSNKQGATRRWRMVANLFYEKYCACEFMDSMFIFGGVVRRQVTNDSFCFKPGDGGKELAGMLEPRYSAACVAYEGKVIVSGGISEKFEQMKTVESYDAHSDTWSPLPSMINSRSDHSLVVVKNKLFVVGKLQDAIEVYDKTCGMFVCFKTTPLSKQFFLF